MDSVLPKMNKLWSLRNELSKSLTTQRVQRPVLNARLEPLVTFQVCEFLVIKFPLLLSAKFRGKLGQAHPGLGNQA